MKHASVLLALTIGLVAMTRAASAQTPPDSLRACARQPDPSARLQCYDAQMAAMGVAVATAPPAATGAAPVVSATPAAPAAPSAAPPPPVVASVAPTAPPPTAEQRFGMDDLKEAKRPPPAPAEKLLLATITSIKEVRPKVWVIGLSNGQIWLQEGTQITSFFKAGFDARIEKGLFSDYRMSTTQTGEKNMVRVTRLQ
jgi:hypothetical protein